MTNTYSRKLTISSIFILIAVFLYAGVSHALRPPIGDINERTGNASIDTLSKIDDDIPIPDEPYGIDAMEERRREILEKIRGVEVIPELDEQKLSRVLTRVSQRYRQLCERFISESESRESPFATSIVWKDYHHPRSGWKLEDPMGAEGKYDFRLERPISGHITGLISFLLQFDEDTNLLVDIRPGTLNETREAAGSGIFIIHTLSIPGTVLVRIIDLESGIMKARTEEVIREYVKEEYAFLQRRKYLQYILSRVEKAISDRRRKLHKRLKNKGPGKKTASKIRIAILKEENNFKPYRAMLAHLRLTYEERVTAEVVPNEENAYPLAGVVSYKDLGLSSPLDLLTRFEAMYPAVEDMLLKGKVPNKPLFLPEPVPAGASNAAQQSL